MLPPQWLHLDVPIIFLLQKICHLAARHQIPQRKAPLPIDALPQFEQVVAKLTGDLTAESLREEGCKELLWYFGDVLRVFVAAGAAIPIVI